MPPTINPTPLPYVCLADTAPGAWALSGALQRDTPGRWACLEVDADAARPAEREWRAEGPLAARVVAERVELAWRIDPAVFDWVPGQPKPAHRRPVACLALAAAGRLLLQRRSRLVDHPGTWGLPGGTGQWGEAAVDTALREAAEEHPGLPEAEPVAVHRGGCAYVLATAAGPTDVGRNWEVAEAAWVAPHDVPGRPLHPGLASDWPGLRESLVRRGVL
jgi:hypothetical protein